MKTIKTAVITDWYGGVVGTPSEEAQDIIASLQDFEVPVELVFHDVGMTAINRQIGIDLLIVDFGGLSVAMGGDSTGTFHIWAAVKWAEDHPGKLMILWTPFTVRIYQREVAQDFGELGNVVLHQGYALDEIAKKIESWYQVS